METQIWYISTVTTQTHMVKGLFAKMCFQTSNFELNLLHVSSGDSFFKTYFMSKHKFELILLPCGFLKSYCVSMHKEYCFT